MGRHRDAVKALEDAVRGWCDVLLEHEASYALSELLRLAGCLGDVDLLQRVEVELLPRFVLHARSSPDSRAFVALAAGRAAFELGRLKDAIQHLADAGAPWHAAPSHCNRSRLRWLARSRRAIGDSAVAERILLGLLSGCPYPTEATGSGTWLAGSRAAASLEAADDFALLALVDAELEAGDPVPPLLALERRAPESVCAILGDATRDRAAASKVASEWRY
ncbi:MAG TPA: hypothetical protein PLU22_07570 [Polyangiaceae bacterium]|nr:hypothetical protein [Polyangiaceae bacterium]